MSEQEKYRVWLDIKLEGNMARQFRYVQKELGFTTYKTTLIYLINDAYERARKEEKAKHE